ncbi:signal transduction histidine kinase, nitrogen specific, NtrB [Caldithrix abyssi DSM 13497]|uniref:histidine kinase n=1 Tax=Caldithrix abyssi DSM 13497 TaxID=880073 RepID=H1XV44_CALAY|nr:sensor histidine kinase [Caldithrix abyssi]APF18917.1 Signal transduction histidine kinase, nitrogen specific [Caldithrix abyssi DSM 13497]EHO42877.1 signal transduction histidine kinase, nitrogen specific, NtrB [Caldithrix abyssi DSM 13497]
MEEQSSSIAIVTRNTERFQIFKNILKEICPRILPLNIDQRLEVNFFHESFDLILVDFAHDLKARFKDIEHLVEHRNLKDKTFLYVLNPKQESLKHQIYRYPNSQILIDPVDKFSLITLARAGIRLSLIHRRIETYKELLEGEQKLISYIDELLDIDRIHEYDNFEEVKQFLQSPLLKKIELTLAVETAYFGFYEEEENRLLLQERSRPNKLERLVYFSLEKSHTHWLLKQNKTLVFEKTDLVDPLIQELEEYLGFKIISLLFAPINLFHRPFGALILINKIYRESFSENDLSFAMIAAQRLAFNLEQYLIQSDSHEHFKHLPINLFSQDQFEKFELIQNILKAVHFGVVVFDNEQRIKFLNPSAVQILNVKAPLKKIRYLKDILNEKNIREILALIKENPLPIIRQEIELERTLLSNVYIGLSIYPYDQNKKKTEYIMVFSEITQTKRIQAEIIRMDRMASLGVLSAGIAHEIRNPLAGIKAMAQSLEDELQDEPSKLEYLSRILRQVNRLEKLLKAFFSYARPVRPDPKQCSIKKVINEVFPLIQTRFREKRIKVETFYAEDLADVFVDPNQIQQVLLNLFINAIDAMPDGGVLRIEAQNALNTQPILDRRKRNPNLLSDKFIKISISDTGVGIPPDVLELIFNPFFTTKSQGTGLGLSIVYQIIKEHGGQIDVESAPGKGSTFHIYLPAL